ncbi:oligoendopeptidase, M3 family [Ignavigranum ruoffiae]|uniref:Oligoendopeptidase, M3 family n=1 Tax=Ignavigranum ruoffiae TaxID=89093 RepID=A0A1H9DSQ2_9LACT|nr:M3 family oligoendopeptidase [Ignavigranum ruoffiae]SEQ16524.1 oligoendopeptidase, M3 family [Ignavigranum ruoffiae]
MKFSEFPYRRPDLEAVKADFDQHIEQIKQANQAKDIKNAIKNIQDLQTMIETQATLASIRNSIDTRDAFYEEEMAFWDEHLPIIQEWVTSYYKAVLDLANLEDYAELFPATLVKMAENSIRVFDSKIIPLLQQENKLTTEYDKLIASAAIEYKGQTYNIPGLGKFMQSTDRQERQTVNELLAQFFADHEEDFDRIYDELVKVRNQMALDLGFKDFTEMGYARMNRLDYNRSDVEVYRQEVLKYVVPVAQAYYQRQQERLGLSELKYYDLPIEFEDGNATPEGTPEEILDAAIKMYSELSPETSEFIDFMVKHRLMDLVTKPGKRAGGYCTYMPDFNSPFIFSNFNGTSGDVDVLTHEAGHAFQVYESRWISAPEIVFPTYESCEIHSMSMEFFAWPWMELFFGDQTDKYKYAHLGGAITFLPYGVLVDHFQHEVYEHPQWTPAERKQRWRELEQMYLPWKDCDGNDFFERGGFWFKQGHIFSSPFYYIDYTLAQMCALQFWQRNHVEEDASAWSDYLELCQVGGTKSFLELVALGHLKSPFETDSLKHLAADVDQYLLVASQNLE